MEQALGIVIVAVVAAAALVAIVTLATSGRTYDPIGRGGLSLRDGSDRPAREPAQSSAAAARERDDEIRQLLEARNEVRCSSRRSTRASSRRSGRSSSRATSGGPAAGSRRSTSSRRSRGRSVNSAAARKADAAPDANGASPTRRLLMHRLSPARARIVLAVGAAAAVIALAAAGGAPAALDHHSAAGHHHADAVRTAKAQRLHNDMRKLWEDHITWTRLAIVSFAHDLPDLPATEARLLDNQVDIGNAIKPYYGRAAGNRLTALLKEHITGAVALLVAAKAGDQALIAQRSDEWYANGNEIADFLSHANPRHWPQEEMRRMMKTHLDQTLSEATHRLGGDYAADIHDYEEIHHHILEMADMLSGGIIKQFPRRFR